MNVHLYEKSGDDPKLYTRVSSSEPVTVHNETSAPIHLKWTSRVTGSQIGSLEIPAMGLAALNLDPHQPVELHASQLVTRHAPSGKKRDRVKSCEGCLGIDPTP